MPRRSPQIRAPWLAAAALAVLAGAPRAALAQETKPSDRQIIVYNKGQTLHYDPDAGADLKEVILETYDCKERKKVNQEVLQTYYHLSEDKEIITPAAICEDCRKVFKIEKRDDKYFFLGIRETPATTPEEVKAVETAAPPATSAETAASLQDKVRKIAQEIVKVDANKKGSAAVRSKIITSELTSSMQGLGPEDLSKIAGFVSGDATLSAANKYYVMRSFGFMFFEKKDYPKAIFFYDRCIELSPDNYSGYFQKGVAEDQSGQLDGAIRSYAKALALKPQASIASYFGKLVRRAPSTEKLSAERIGELRVKVASIEGALRDNEADRAKTESKAVLDLVEGWYGGGAAKPPAPPPAPAPAPGGSPEDAGSGD